jgi:hypothetical protein
MNQDLSNLHDLLCAQHDALYESLDSAPDSDTMDAIMTEMREVRHRIDITQGLLFRAESQKLSDCLKGINAANADLTAALKTVKTATDVVKGVSKFLTLVDKALDLAKSLAVI